MKFRDIKDFPEHGRWELFNGELYIQPETFMNHADVKSILLGDLFSQKKENHKIFQGIGVWPYAKSIDDIMDAQDFVMPDATIVKREQICRMGCLGAPELIVEVTSAETYWRDFFCKSQLYCKAGVPWYVIISPDEGAQVITPDRKIELYTGGSFEAAGYKFDLDFIFENVVYKDHNSVTLEEAQKFIDDGNIFGESE
jgi:Uma2 family endonuclease